MERVETHIGEEGKTVERMKILEILELNGYPQSFIREVERKKYRTHELRMSEDMGKKDEENGHSTSWLVMLYACCGFGEPVAPALRPLGTRVAHKAEQRKLAALLKNQGSTTGAQAERSGMFE